MASRHGLTVAAICNAQELGVDAAADKLAADAPKPKERKPRAPKEPVDLEPTRKSERERKEVSYKEEDYLRELGRLGIVREKQAPRHLDEEEMQALREKHGIRNLEDLDGQLNEEDMTASQREAKKRGPVDSGKGVRIMVGEAVTHAKPHTLPLKPPLPAPHAMRCLFPALCCPQGGKVYDSKFGVTCHWCRQKTLTENVTCTNPNCGGGRRIPTTFW
jgi:hypothetical protein